LQPEEARLLESIGAAAQELPRSVIEELCDELAGMSEDFSPSQRASLPAIVAAPGARVRVSGLIEAWNSAPNVSPANLAWALRAASDVDERRLREQTIELVWTGPSLEGTVLRRTDQVLLDLIRTARSTLHIVTFAAYRIPVLNEAMLEAARRGVEISLIFETPGSSDGKMAFASLDALGDDLKALSKVYVWPLDRRPKDRAGRYGSLHAKFAVADEAALLVSSANLTEYAFNFNMELGLLVRGGDLPADVKTHLRRLVEERLLLPI
jgi:phosphatidylserine/phosphatidylglycerophosphate/cardiolipin synthase-like enzyme